MAPSALTVKHVVLHFSILVRSDLDNFKVELAHGITVTGQMGPAKNLLGVLACDGDMGPVGYVF